MRGFLKRPFPIDHPISVKWTLCIGASIFVFLFLLVFSPFEILEHLKIDAFLALFGYFVVTFIMSFLYTMIIHPIIDQRFGETWTMGKEILSIFSLVTAIGIANHFYIISIYSMERMQGYTLIDLFFQNMYFTYTIALFPALAAIVYIELKARNQFETQSSEVHPISHETIQPFEVKVIGESSDSSILLTSSDFRFAKASGNYVEYYSVVNGQLQKELQRNTLSKLEEQLQKTQFRIARTHRSYLVNLDIIEKISGNAQGYSLKLNDTDHSVPVSRSNIPEFNRVMNDN